ncbi:erythroblast NAD(P)(+)--arginine ADP-ribosyltransferase-like [Salmo salar]|uniref:NAD(P)(+)--arginine ADP-ribosyltransferase n=1 Tax=Salmo salar TaxID=8030 RepID=A0A1S3REB8_SALSA|nr:erythroblast NAD(P)(+)--arginine ADP-ribosyltransferase-like [Salmo salar]|eukprot:XP_014050202.1 PREDICTED: erythroblast NAD(P)(+)--arginine ADP-ribosyltransferase-like [Salmo salar]
MARQKILTFAVMHFIQDWTLGVDSKMVHLHQPGLNFPVPLDMVPNSIDDKFKHCTEKMYKKVQEEYLPNENPTEGIFKQAWMKAEGCATIEKVKKRFQKDKSKYNPEELTHDHIKAICAYTAEEPEIYSVFNQAVRTNRTECTTSFQFHSLHFLLTDALRLLKENQLGCHTTYRRSNMSVKVNKVIRFGFFASSSLDKGISKRFGEKSCFEITTCFGAYLKSFPKLGNHEKEVLIPPYEEFRVIAVLKKENDRNLWCDVVYKLKNIKAPRSNLNCKLFK